MRKKSVKKGFPPQEETGETSVREAGLKGVWSGNIWQSRLHDRYTYT